jgi:hypothetical protein
MLLVSVLVMSAAACAPRLARAPRSLPVGAQLNMSRLTHVWVAGFLVSHDADIDLNLETVRFLRTQIRSVSSASVVEAEPLVIDTEQRLSDTAYWRRLGQEHGAPLVVTGSVKLFPAPPTIESRGPRTVYIPMMGRVLEATVVLIDGHTGESLSTQKLPTRMRYGLGRLSSGLSLYFQLMDRARSDWLTAIAGYRPRP